MRNNFNPPKSNSKYKSKSNSKPKSKYKSEYKSEYKKPVKTEYKGRYEKKAAKTTRDIPKNIPSVTVAPVREPHVDESIIFGRNAVIELLKSGRTIDKIFIQKNQREGSLTLIAAEAIRMSVPLIEVEKTKLDKMINGTSHQGVAALTSEIEYCSVDDIISLAEERGEKPFVLIADKIMDSQNLGAIIRTAECAGVHGIIIPKRHAVGVSAVVGKISAGAVFHIKIAKVSNVASAIEDLKERGVWIFASTSAFDGSTDSEREVKREIKNYCDADYNLPLCLVVGNEGEGLSQLVFKKSDFFVNIPMYGKIESLNVSCAAAVLLYEIARQRRCILPNERDSVPNPD